MFRRFLLIVFCVFAFPTIATACDCSANQSIIEGMDLQIAERRAKLKFVVDGGQESATGYSNDPRTLAREIREISDVRDRMIKEQTDCQKRCTRQLDKSIFDPSTTSPVLIAKCPECSEQYDAFNGADVRLSLAIRNLELFKSENPTKTATQERPPSRGQAQQDFERASVELSEAIGTLEYLEAMRDKACGPNAILPNTQSSYYNPSLVQPDEEFVSEEPAPPADRPRILQDEDWDSPITDEEGNEVVVLDDDGEEISPRQYRELVEEEYRAEQQREAAIEELTNMPKAVYQIPALMLESVGQEVDRLIDLVRSHDLDIPHGLELTEYGECLKWTRLIDQHYERVLRPADAAFHIARRNLPTSNETTFQELRSLEDAVRQARAQRDAAMDALIDCNAKNCRKKPEVSAQFIDEADPAGEVELPLPPAGDPTTLPIPIDPNPDGLLPLEPLPISPTPLPTPPPLIAPVPEGLGIIPEFPINPVGDLPEPPTGEGTSDGLPVAPHSGMFDPVESPDSGLTTLPPSLAKDQPGTLQELLEQREAALAAGLIRDPKGVCEFDLDDVCAKLGGEEAARCKAETTLWLNECRAVRDYEPKRSLGYCYARCDVQATEARNANFLQSLVISLVQKQQAKPTDEQREKQQTIQQQLENAEIEFDALEKRLNERIIHIYTNIETGAIIQHSGEKFEPQPPLEYTGEMQAPISEKDKASREQLKAEIEQLTVELFNMTGESSQTNEWYQSALHFWAGREAYLFDKNADRFDLTTYSPVACRAEEVAPLLAECRAFCDAQMPIPKEAGGGPSPTTFCKPNGVLGLLHQPSSRKWIFPPGDPRQAPGFGR